MSGPDENDRETLIAEIARSQDDVARASAELAKHKRRLGELRSRLAQLAESRAGNQEPALVAMTPDRKVELFLSLFRGRTDVYPTRFVRKRDGQAGYAPDCRNKFVKGVCELPKVSAASAQTRRSGPSTAIPSASI